MSEFNKLDHFMRTHKPVLKEAKPFELKSSKKVIPWLSLGMATISLALFILTQQTQEPLYMESLYVAETIEWEIEEDGLLSYYDII